MGLFKEPVFSNVLEQALIYVLQLQDVGEPVLDEASVARAHAGIYVLMLLGCMLTYADVC